MLSKEAIEKNRAEWEAGRDPKWESKFQEVFESFCPEMDSTTVHYFISSDNTLSVANYPSTPLEDFGEHSWAYA